MLEQRVTTSDVAACKWPTPGRGKSHVPTALWGSRPSFPNSKSSSCLNWEMQRHSGANHFNGRVAVLTRDAKRRVSTFVIPPCPTLAAAAARPVQYPCTASQPTDLCIQACVSHRDCASANPVLITLFSHLISQSHAPSAPGIPAYDSSRWRSASSRLPSAMTISKVSSSCVYSLQPFLTGRRGVRRVPDSLQDVARAHNRDRYGRHHD